MREGRDHFILGNFLFHWSMKMKALSLMQNAGVSETQSEVLGCWKGIALLGARSKMFKLNQLFSFS